MKKVLFLLSKELFRESYAAASKQGFSSFSEYLRHSLRLANKKAPKKEDSDPE